MTEAGPASATTGERGVSASRVRIVDAIPPGRQALARIASAHPRFALAEPISLEALPAADESVDPSQELFLLEVPVGTEGSYAGQQRAADWVAAPAAAGIPSVEIVVQSVGIKWRPGRAVLVGGTPAMDELLPGLIAFALTEGELRRLEVEVEGFWPNAERDTALTHKVDRAAVARWDAVGRITQAVALCRQRFVRLEPLLAKAPLDLPPPARRLFAELLVQIDAPDRLRFVDDKIEVLEDLYEIANGRISEFRYFDVERRLEILIVVVLLLELAAFFVWSD